MKPGDGMARVIQPTAPTRYEYTETLEDGSLWTYYADAGHTDEERRITARALAALAALAIKEVG